MSDQGNIGNVNIHITATTNLTSFEKAFQKAGIAASAGLQKVRDELSSLASGATKAETATGKLLREFGQKVVFKDPFSGSPIFTNIQGAINLLKSLKRELADIQTVEAKGRLFPDVAAQKERVLAAIQSIEKQLVTLGQGTKASPILPQVTQAERALRSFGAIQQRAIADNKKFDESLKLKNSGVPQIAAAERALRSYSLMQARAIAENKKFDDGLKGGLGFINRHATAINQLSFSAARAGTGFANFLPLIARSSTLFAGAAASAGGMGNALTAAKASISSAATALGGVSLAAVVAVAAVALVVVAFGFLLAKLGPLGGAMNHLKNQIADTFESSSDQVNQFAQDFGSALGLSETAALTFIGRVGQLFQAQGETAQASAEISEGLLVAASVFRETTIGAGSFDEALRAVQNTLAGNIEGLREYNVLITEADLRQQAASRGINVASGALDAQTRQYLAALEVIDQAQDRLATQTEAQKSLAAETSKLGAVFTDVKNIISQAFGVVLAAVLPVIRGFFEDIRKGFQVLREAISQSENFQKALKGLAGFFTGSLRAAIRGAGLAIEGFVIGLAGLVKLLDVILKPISFIVDKIQAVVDKITSALRALGLMGEAEGEAATKARELAEAENELEKSAKEAALAHEQTAENLQRLVDGYDDLTEAIKDAEKAENDAEIALARTVEDNARKIADAQRNLAKAYRDRNRAIQDANEKLSDIEVQNNRALFDAQKKLADARRDAQKALRNAEEKLKDARLDATRKVAEAERSLADARQQHFDQLLNAQLSVFEAQLKGDAFALNRARLEETRARRDKAVKDAERKLDETKVDTAKNIADAERDLAEVRAEALRKIAEAELALQRVREDNAERLRDAERERAQAFEDANERIAEAQRRLHEVEIENNRQLFDANKRLNEVREEGNKKVLEAIEHVKELNAEFATTVEEARVWLAFLDAAEENLKRQAARGHTEGFTGHGASGTFAHGGFLDRGKVGITGERGRELVIGGQSGSTILPHDITERLLALLKGDSGGRVSQTVNVTTNREDPEVIASKVSSRLVRGVS